MRLVVQRCLEASVTVDGKVVSKIGKGCLVLVGITCDDTPDDAKLMAKKLLGCRLWENQDGKPWSSDVRAIEGEVLCVSQFTLYGTLNKGTKPDFHAAMKSDRSKQFYHDFLELVRQGYQPDRVQDGIFGAMMDVAIINHGPVTLQIDSRKFTYDHVLREKEKAKADAERSKKQQEKAKKQQENATSSVPTSAAAQHGAAAVAAVEQVVQQQVVQQQGDPACEQKAESSSVSHAAAAAKVPSSESQ